MKNQVRELNIDKKNKWNRKFKREKRNAKKKRNMQIALKKNLERNFVKTES